MTKVTIHLATSHVMREVFFDSDSVKLVRDNFHEYKNAGTFETLFEGEDAAEEAFDLTNNPSRQNEREKVYGRGRSVSSGDVIDVDGVKFVCMSVGWKQL